MTPIYSVITAKTGIRQEISPVNWMIVLMSDPDVFMDLARKVAVVFTYLPFKLHGQKQTPMGSVSDHVLAHFAYHLQTHACAAKQIRGVDKKAFQQAAKHQLLKQL